MKLDELVGTGRLAMLSSILLELAFPFLRILNCLLQRGLLGHQLRIRIRIRKLRVRLRLVLLMLLLLAIWLGRRLRRRKDAVVRAQIDSVVRAIAKRHSL